MVLLLLIRVYDVSKISLILGECCEAVYSTIPSRHISIATVSSEGDTVLSAVVIQCRRVFALLIQ